MHLQVVSDNLQAIEDMVSSSFSLKRATHLLKGAGDGKSSGVAGGKACA